eukprot:2026176-Amphidinium_carterae.1
MSTCHPWIEVNVDHRPDQCASSRPVWRMLPPRRPPPSQQGGPGLEHIREARGKAAAGYPSGEWRMLGTGPVPTLAAAVEAEGQL